MLSQFRGRVRGYEEELQETDLKTIYILQKYIFQMMFHFL